MNTQTQTETPFIAQVQRHGKRMSRRGLGGFAGKRQAVHELTEQLEHDHVMESFDPDATPSTAPTLAAYYRDRYHMHRQATQLEHSRQVWNPSYRYVLHHLGNVPLDECGDKSTVDELVDRVKATGSISFDESTGDVVKIIGKPLADGTINGILNALTAILNLAFEEGVVKKAPRIRKLETGKRTPIVPVVEDIKKLLTTVRTLADRAPYLVEVIFMVMDTGMRKRELFNLRWRDVDLESEALHIQQSGRDRLGNGRPYQQRHDWQRTIPMTARVKAILNHLYASAPNGEADLVIPNQNGAPYIPVDSTNRKGFRGFDTAVRKACLQGRISFLSLRDLFAHRLLTQGVPMAYVADLTGYREGRMAEKRYGDRVSDERSNRTDFARRWFDGGDD